MSYQVLARKWRPKQFSELVGQSHVVRALENGLDHQRLHHAFLFTGTRGVGKTTIARILAKSLNCEQGISSKPCGNCRTCVDIDQGNYVDLLEIDAASRTRVDDTKEILANVPYAPSRGRYKIYLIDEVHMLSTHSFNALLKTLEEPPDHVKFILATTDPQKIPVTIISRCLQFHLKRIEIGKIVEQLARILQAEQIEFAKQALFYLAKAADGSMRDALSLLDQAIAFGAGKIEEASVKDMLGTIEDQYVVDILKALAISDGKKLLDIIGEVGDLTQNYTALLQDIALMCHQLLLMQQIPNLKQEQGNQTLTELVNSINAENLQLYYEIAIQGRQQLELAPDPKTGAEMTLLRMLAFKPENPSHDEKIDNQPEKTTAPEQKVLATDHKQSKVEQPSITKQPSVIDESIKKAQQPNQIVSEANPEDYQTFTSKDWEQMINELQIKGPLKALAMHCGNFVDAENYRELSIDKNHEHFLNDVLKSRLEEMLNSHFQMKKTLRMVIGNHSQKKISTPQQKQDVKEKKQQDVLNQALAQDQVVQDIQQQFDAVVLPETVVANNQQTES